jgi:hypothetical protein
MSRAALLQLVSEQTLPNILPALALEPAEIVLLHTPRTQRHANQIRGALQKAGLPLHTRLIALSGVPDIRETGAAVKQAAAALPAHLTPVVNFTGGTKLMSIGAFVAAYTAQTPSLYVDTANLAFTDGGTGDLPLVLRDNHAALAPLQTALNFFGGGWWELAVFDAAQRSGKFRDLRWSVTITVAGQTYEKDLIALHGLNLALFSCKRGGGKNRLVAALDELDANARQIGGTHARRYFCVAAAISKPQIAPLQERARQTGTQIIGPAQSLNPNSF